MHRFIFDRHHRLNPAMQISRHQVGGRDVDAGTGVRQAMAGTEAVNSRMFKKSADNAFDVNVLRQAAQTRAHVSP